MNIIVAPDSFKGSLSAIDVGKTIERAFSQEYEEAQITVIPMADGGEGTLAALLYSTNGQCVQHHSSGPDGTTIAACYGILGGDRETVVIEVASVVGITLVEKNFRNPLLYTTYGVGELILTALDKGYRDFIIGLGGSITNDGGMGMLQALGVQFLDEDQKCVSPIAHSLQKVRSVSYEAVDPRIWKSNLRIACDVENPLCGLRGATYVFGPQKGLSLDQLERLDQGMSVYANCVEKHLQRQHQQLPGAGAAGGLGFALMTLGAKMESGASLVAKAADIERRFTETDWLITGEGYTDEQSLQGKLPYYLAKLAKKYNVPTILLSGGLDGKLESLFDYFDSMHSIADGPLSLETSIEQAERLLFHKSRNIARLLKRQTKHEIV